MAQMNLVGRSEVTMFSNGLGDSLAGIPGKIEDQVFVAQDAIKRMLVEDRHELGLEGSIHAYERIFILFHELSHCEFHEMDVGFVDPSGNLSPSAVSAMNNWVCIRKSVLPSGIHYIQHESFADAYAAMMLLETTDHSDIAKHTILNWLSVRKKDQKFRHGPEIDKIRMDPYGGTGYALDAVLDSMGEWRGAGPEKIREKALEISSEATLSYFGFLQEKGLAGFDGGKEGWSKNLPPFKDLVRAQLFNLVIVNRALPMDVVMGTYRTENPGHPLVPLMEELWEKNQAQLQEAREWVSYLCDQGEGYGPIPEPASSQVPGLNGFTIPHEVWEEAHRMVANAEGEMRERNDPVFKKAKDAFEKDVASLASIQLPTSPAPSPGRSYLLPARGAGAQVPGAPRCPVLSVGEAFGSGPRLPRSQPCLRL